MRALLVEYSAGDWWYQSTNWSSAGSPMIGNSEGDGGGVTRCAVCSTLPDGRFSRIRLSDKNSRLRPRKTSRSITQANEAEFVMQPRIGESCRDQKRGTQRNGITLSSNVLFQQSLTQLRSGLLHEWVLLGRRFPAPEARCGRDGRDYVPLSSPSPFLAPLSCFVPLSCVRVIPAGVACARGRPSPGSERVNCTTPKTRGRGSPGIITVGPLHQIRSVTLPGGTTRLRLMPAPLASTA